MSNKRATITSAGFVILLACLLVLCILTPDKKFSDNENRNLQQMPVLKTANIVSGTYMKNFEAYASDSIIARDGWVKIKNLADFISGKKDNGTAYFGQDGYLFPVDNIDKNQFEKNLIYTKNFLNKAKEQNEEINISLLIVPTSSEILREKMPKYASGLEQHKLLEKAESYFNSSLINPEEELLKHKDEYIYYRTDHHWTTLGAYYTYRLWAQKNEIEPLSADVFKIEAVSDQFYGTTYSKAAGIKVMPDSIEKFSYPSIDNVGMSIESLKETKKLPSLYDKNYLKNKDKYSYFLSGNNPLTVIEGTAENGRNILVVKDSYANCFVPFITQHFQRIYVVDLRYYKESLLNLTKEKDMTDILFLYNVIQFSNDRNLVYLLTE